MPVTNIDPASAMDLGALPIAVNEDVSTAATGPNGRHEVWFQYTHNTLDIAIALAFLAPSTSNFAPQVTLYASLADALAGNFYLNFRFITNLSLQVPVTFGQTYYAVVVNANSTNPLTGTLTVSGSAPPALAAPVGSFLIIEAAGSFPLVGVSAVDGSILQLRDAPTRTDYPGGDAGQLLPNGISLVQDTIAAAGTWQLFGPGPDMLHLAEVLVGVPNTGLPAISSNRKDSFYVGYPGTTGNAHISLVSQAGVVSGTTYTLGAKPLQSIAPSLDESILYYQPTGAAAALKRWNLATNTALTDLAAGVASYFPGKDILVLSDGTLLVAYLKSSVVQDHYVRHYSAAGAILRTYNFGVNFFNRMMHAAEDDTTFWVWTFDGTDAVAANNVWQQIRVSDGVVLVTLTTPQFEQGIYQGAISDVLTIPLGVSATCPFMIYPPNNPFGPNDNPPAIAAPPTGAPAPPCVPAMLDGLSVAVCPPTPPMLRGIA